MRYSSTENDKTPEPDAIFRPTSETAEWLSHRSDPMAPSSGSGSDWVRATLPHLTAAATFCLPQQRVSHPLRVLVLYGTQNSAGYSKLLAYECARLIEGLGADVRTFDPHGLPMRDPDHEEHPKVVELRALVQWSEAHIWVGSELHGTVCSVLKNQIDWIPVNSETMRITDGKSVAVYQVNGGNQSFNAVNQLRMMAKWMRMICTVNHGVVPKAWSEFDENGRMMESSLRDRVVDVCEEFYRFSIINRDFENVLMDRYSERKERERNMVSVNKRS